MSEEKFRVESDLLGELKVPIDAYYGVQTQRGINTTTFHERKCVIIPTMLWQLPT